MEIRNYILTFLANKGASMQAFSVMALVQLLCRITKYAWFDAGDAIRAIVSETSKFLSATVAHCVIGLRILNELVSEMNYRNRNRTLSQQRKVAVSFRDTALLPVFEISLSMLNQIATRSIPVDDGVAPADHARTEGILQELALSLLTACLNFDFIGTYPDDSAEEVGTIQVPSTWRDRIQNGATLRLLFNVYKGATTGRIPIIPDAPAPPIVPLSSMPNAPTIDTLGLPGRRPLDAAAAAARVAAAGPSRDFPRSTDRATEALEALCLLVSVRRSLFQSDLERKRYLSHILRGLCDILREEQGLEETGCYFAFAKLLSKVKNNFQLSELARTDGYAEWVELTARFTLNACARPGWSSNSMHYILGLWSRLVSSVPYLRIEPAPSVAALHAGGGAVSGSANSVATLPGRSIDVVFDAWIPKIVAAYVRGRVEALTGPDSETALAELEDLEAAEETMEQLPAIARYTYEASAAALIEILDPLLSRYESVSRFAQARPPPTDAALALRVVECQLASLVMVVGAVVGGAASGAATASSSIAYYLGGGGSSASTSSSPGDEAFDADLSRRVLQLAQATDARVAAVVGGALPASVASTAALAAARPDVRLELALIFFLSNFRKSYINEQSGMPPSEVTKPANADVTRDLLFGTKAAAAAMAGEDMSGTPAGTPSLSDRYAASSGRQKAYFGMFLRMGLGDHIAVTTLMLSKLANNLRFWGERGEDVVRRTLDVLHECVFSYSSSRMLLSLECIPPLLRFHTAEHFPFLSPPANTRLRTTFYTVLARLVFADPEGALFEPFFAPLDATLCSLAPALAAPGARSSEPTIRTLVGVARDLRGILIAATKDSTYTTVFEALFPKHVATLAAGLDLLADSPAVTAPLLKCLGELVFSRAGRIAFGSNSASGILLFKHASSGVLGYGRKTLGRSLPPGMDPYAALYKGVALSLTFLSHCLEGGYINFGVFALYGDNTLEASMDVCFQLALSVPEAARFAFPKFALAYTHFLHCVFRSHIESVVALPRDAFRSVLASLKYGLDSLDAEVAGEAAPALDHLASYYVRHAKRDTPTMTALRAHIAANPGIFEALMKVSNV